MRYQGGKAKLGSQIAYVINSIQCDGQPYWEPFCGSCWVTIHIQANGPRYCSDGCYELIEMWKALQGGWKPPRVVTEEMYTMAEAGNYDAHMRGFIGFGCSFGGKWFGGYARDPNSDRNYAQAAASGIINRAGKMQNVRFYHADYSKPDLADNMLIYADPPYADTIGYAGSMFPFDTSEFWQVVRRWIQRGHVVVVSEYIAPDDFRCVWEMLTTTGLRTVSNGSESRIERLFVHHTQVDLADVIPRQVKLKGF